LLKKYGLRLHKGLGQHFLVDEQVLAKIADLVQRFDVSRVVELGPGAGALTCHLLEAGLTVEALELDRRMIELLDAELASPQLQVVHADIARTDLAAHVGTSPMMFVGNLPYQVTSPVLFGLMPALRQPQARGAVLMMQAEVADRLAADPGGKDYGVLSVLIQAQVVVERRFTVSPGSFLPPPKVQSTVVELVPRADRVELGQTGTALVKELFSQRRKQIGGLLRRAYEVEESDLERLSPELRIDPHCRAENLSLEEFQRLDRWIRDRSEA